MGKRMRWVSTRAGRDVEHIPSKRELKNAVPPASPESRKDAARRERRRMWEQYQQYPNLFPKVPDWWSGEGDR